MAKTALKLNYYAKYAQQDYIVIDWEGKAESDEGKKAEVDSLLKNIYLANPRALFSVIMKNYAVMTSSAESPVFGWYYDSGSLEVSFHSFEGEIATITVEIQQ